MNEGKKDRRDPIRTIKTKNPVAKAHQTVGTGSGAHKDKKKAAKQGDVKHKKAEYTESYEQYLQNKLNEAAKVDPNASFDYDAWSKSGKKPRQPGKAVKQLAQQTRDAQKKKQQGVAEGNPWANVIHTTDRSAEKAQRELKHKQAVANSAKVLKNHAKALDPAEIDLLTRYNLHHRGKPDVRFDRLDDEKAEKLIQSVLRFNKQGVAESITKRIQQLLDSGATVRSGVMGRVGKITGTSDDMVHLTTNRGRKAATSFENGDFVGIFKRKDGSYIIRNTDPAFDEFGWGGTSDGEKAVAEGFFGDIKQSFATGMVDKLKKAIPAQYHKHYDFDSVKSPSDTKAIVAQARAAGHLKEQGVAEEMDIPADGTPEYDQYIHRGGKTPYDLGGADAYYGRQNDITKEYGFQKGSPEWDEYIQGYRDTYQNKDMRKDYGTGRPSPVTPRRITKTSEAMNGITGPGMIDYRPSEGADYDQGEYDDEAGMAQGNLYTIAQAAQGLLNTIEDHDNLPEWAQEKIAKVEGMLVSVWNYLQSQKAQGIDPKVSEAQSALEKFRKGSAEREKKHADIEAKRKAAPAGSGMSAAIDRLSKQVKGEGWTHDSLADQLFEHERTYEEKLANQLKRKLGK